MIFVYLITDIPHNLTLLTSTTQGSATEGLSGKLYATNSAQRLINRT